MVYVGEDFRFGHKRTGNVEDLRKALMAAEVTKVERIKYGGEIVSSTRIRSLLVQGQHEEAEELLG